MSARSEALFTAFIETVKRSGDADVVFSGFDEQGCGVAVYDCRCGALKCVGLTLAMLSPEGIPATLALTPELSTSLAEALLKVGSS